MKYPESTRPRIYATRRKSHVDAGTITKAHFQNGFAIDVFFPGTDKSEILVRDFPLRVDPVIDWMWRCF